MTLLIEQKIEDAYQNLDQVFEFCKRLVKGDVPSYINPQNELTCMEARLDEVKDTLMWIEEEMEEVNEEAKTFLSKVEDALDDMRKWR